MKHSNNPQGLVIPIPTATSNQPLPPASAEYVEVYQEDGEAPEADFLRRSFRQTVDMLLPPDTRSQMEHLPHENLQYLQRRNVCRSNNCVSEPDGTISDEIVPYIFAVAQSRPKLCRSLPMTNRSKANASASPTSLRTGRSSMCRSRQ